MPAKIECSKGVRGTFHRRGVHLRLPIYFDDTTQNYLAERAQAKGVDMTPVVNRLLKKDIELIETAR